MTCWNGCATYVEYGYHPDYNAGFASAAIFGGLALLADLALLPITLTGLVYQLLTQRPGL